MNNNQILFIARGVYAISFLTFPLGLLSMDLFYIVSFINVCSGVAMIVWMFKAGDFGEQGFFH